MKKRLAAAILCGILSLTSVPAYASELETQIVEADADIFTSEPLTESADVQETASEDITQETQESEADLFTDFISDGTSESVSGESEPTADGSEDSAGDDTLSTEEQDSAADENTFSAEEQDGTATEGNLSSVEETVTDLEEGIHEADDSDDAALDDGIAEAEAAQEEQADAELTGASVSSVGVDATAVKSGALGETWKWDAASGTFSCYDSAGTQLSIADIVSKYTATGSYYGYFQINGKYYCLDDTGKPRTGEVQLTVGGTVATYYFQPEANSEGIPGEMYTGWRKVAGENGDQWLYYDTGSSNAADRGKLLVHGIIATKLDTAVMGDSMYLLDSSGYLLKNEMKNAEDGSVYLSDANGAVYTYALVTYNGSQYYVGKDGKRATFTNSWHRLKYVDNRYYYFGKTPGKVVKKTGWQAVKVNGKFKGWYYFNKNGVHLVSRYLKRGIYFTSTGCLASGPTEMDGKMYFFSVSTAKKRAGKMLKSQLAKYKGKWYYASSSGRLKKKGWVKVDGEYYYLKNYTVVTDTFITKNGVSGYVDSTGRFTTGWVIVDEEANKVKYVDVAKKKFVKNTSRVIDGLKYYFDEDGYRINDVTDRVSGPYSLVVDRVNGVITIYNEDRTIPVKSVRCSVGAASTPTVTGTYTLTRAGRWQLMMGDSWGQYASQITGNYLIHSVPMGTKDAHDVATPYYYALGTPASHGCVRTNVADAKWIYENCNGSTITILDGTYEDKECFKGPLGRYAIVPMTTAGTDPTDPSV